MHFQETAFADGSAAGGGAAGLRLRGGTRHHELDIRGQPGRLTRVIGQRLPPGGLAYVSYKAMTGWASMMPVRALMQSLPRASGDLSDPAVAGVMDYLDLLKGAGAGFLARNPAVMSMLGNLRKQDPRYLAHEFLNDYWQPLKFADMAALMEGVKCSYVGTASLTENVDAISVPQPMQSLLSEAVSPMMMKTLRGFATA